MRPLATMIVLSLLSVQSFGVEAKDGPDKVAISELRFRPEQNYRRYVTICGTIEVMSDGSRQLFEGAGWQRYAVQLAPDLPVTKGGAKTCANGVFERVDGLSIEEASRQGKYFVIEDMAAHPSYWLIGRSQSSDGRASSAATSPVRQPTKAPAR